MESTLLQQLMLVVVPSLPTMIVLVLVLASCSHVSVIAGNASSENMELKYLHELCPDARVCLGNKTSEGGRETGLNDEVSCCTECSCEPDCDESGDCCFSRGFQGQKENIQSDSFCLYPLLPQPEGRMRLHYQSYLMISDVPKIDNIDIHNVTNTKCGDEKVAIWGSLSPVFSKKKQKIYKNIACANAAHVTDGQLWDAAMSCKYTLNNVGLTDFTTYISDLFSSSLPDNCHMKFVYQGDNSDLIKESCFTDLISTCPSTEFDIPRELALSMAQIRSACTSDLVSPYRMADMFKNVYCYICNGLPFYPATKCSLTSGPKTSTDSIVMLIDGELNLKQDKSLNSPRACPEFRSKESYPCRIIHCPSGHIRDKNGKCIFGAKIWYVTALMLYLKLTADEPFELENKFPNSKLDKQDILHLPDTWQRNWNIDSLSVELTNEKMHTTLFIKIVISSPFNDPRIFFRNVQLLLKLPWMLKTKNRNTIPVSADWSHVIDRFTSINQAEKSLNIPIPKYEHVYQAFRTLAFKRTPTITKLYFCEQIELDSSEFDLYNSDQVLHNKITNQTSYVGKFTTTSLTDGDRGVTTTRVRLCIDDARFTKRENNSVGNVRFKIPVFWCFIVILVIR